MTSLLEGEKAKKVNHQGPIFDEEMITNEFESGIDDDLDAIFGSNASFIETASIMPFEFIYGLDKFKGEFEEDLEALLGSVFVGITFILLVEYGEVQDVETLEGDCVDSIVGDEWMILR